MLFFTAIQEFAETGGTEALDKQPTFSSAKNGGYGSAYDRNRLILDGFSAPPIEEGVGTSQASLFMDGNHTRVRDLYIVLLDKFCKMI